MSKILENDWKSKIARDYFSMTWNGPTEEGVENGDENLPNLYDSIDKTFHKNYQFTRPDGTIINEGTGALKHILKALTSPLKNLRMTSFDIVSLEGDSVTFQSTAIADRKDSAERYTQYLRLTYVFEQEKVKRTIVHYHTNYDG